MFCLVFNDLDTSDLLNIDLFEIREFGFQTGIHFNSKTGYFTFGIQRKEPFNFEFVNNQVDNKQELLIEGKFIIPYPGNTMYYLEDNLEDVIDAYVK